MLDLATTRRLEELTLNTSPAIHQSLYDGWLLRASGTDTRRANSATVMQLSTLPLEEKIAYVEAWYRRHGQSAIFRLTEALAPLVNDRLRDEVAQMQIELAAMLFNLGARKAFAALCTRLRRRLRAASERTAEIHAMLEASYMRLNAQFGFGLSVNVAPELDRYDVELRLIETNYAQYLGFGQALRLAQPRFMEQLRRMLLSKLRLVFEGASSEIDLWSRSASAQVESQLRDRRRGYARRRESLERIQGAAGELDSRLAQLQAQDERAQQVQARLQGLCAALCRQARSAPDGVLSAADVAPAARQLARA